MKSRHSPNLYEILRSASGPRETREAPAAPVAVLPPPPPAPVAPVAEEPEPVVVETPPPAPVARVVEAPPPPPPVVEVRPAPPPAPPRVETPEAPAPAAAGPGERSLRVTYNTILFGGLVAVGAVFLAFTLGVRTGRGQGEAPVTNPELGAAMPQAPSVPAATFTIRLVEYRARNSQEYTRALDAAIRYKNELERLGLKEAVVETIGTTPDRRVVLRYGEYTDAAAQPAKEMLQKLKNAKLDKTSKEPTFAKTAVFQTR